METPHFHIFVLLNYLGVFFTKAVTSAGVLSVTHPALHRKVQTKLGDDVKDGCLLKIVTG